MTSLCRRNISTSYTTVTAAKEIQEYLPGYFVWGTDLGGMLFGYSQKTGMYSAVDSVSLNEDDLMYEEPSLMAFLKRWDAELE